MPVTIGFASLLAAALLASPASAVTAYSPTGHLNVRSGPGFQYQVVGQVQASVPAQITGCLSDYSWCAVALPGGVTGWASAPYLVTKATVPPKNLKVAGAQLGIPVIVPANTGAPVVATPPVGAMVAVPQTVVVQPIIPAPAAITYVTQQRVAPVIVNGEVMVGAVLPTAVPLYDVPTSRYDFAYVNGQRVLVEPTRRRIIYVVR
ncbi:MAG: DUF1236 domain-containing protein [Methyloceanibacter sp.]|uniref:DUF1236 domain-containing protein n=1 Tax=Methyloceanibacter sp. TaxID=1965321 RepID=UPI003D6C946D